MVVALGPGKFYGRGLPRPRFYTDVKYNSYRVDPPVPVTDPFMAWAEEAHWSMGGLNFKRNHTKKSPARCSGGVESEIVTVASSTGDRKPVTESITIVSKGKKRLRKVGEDKNGGTFLSGYLEDRLYNLEALAIAQLALLLGRA
ncbi:hypothetical protein L2E82_10639 [Cichorium intybus]|uniref:Uncharacterized protein n=1 Tax=Cichorium intybus TaxID=13427 RepID=A0ACB9GAL9_CICIN|nr:hypothetical protein L2E82_10639 [Cichorium intybus]